MVILRKVNLETCNLNNFSYPDPLTVWQIRLKVTPLAGQRVGEIAASKRKLFQSPVASVSG